MSKYVSYKDLYYKSADGLTLYARDYGNDGKPVVFCLHGLTRNSADFEFIASNLATNYRVICPDQRGRGLSENDPNPINYRPDVYAADVVTLANHLGVDSINIIGTSLGGLMAMVINMLAPNRIKSCVFNDIGPDIDTAGLDRIKSYVGNAVTFSNWNEAASAVKTSNEAAFPDYVKSDWLAFARRTCIQNNDLIKFAYDPLISEAFKTIDENAAPPDLWPLFGAMSNIPTLIIRGELSDLLSQKTFDKMLAVHPKSSGVIAKNVGHAPMLDESDVVPAITNFLSDFV